MSDEYGPLLALAQRLSSLGPPSLTVLAARIESAEDYKSFVALVREYLPEREQGILRKPDPVGQIAAFISYFSDRYFPLENGYGDMVEGYGEFVARIPLQVMGLSPDDYHEMPDWGHGYQLMTYLLQDPYGDESGARVALADSCREFVPVELLNRVPQGGLGFDQAHELLDETPYEAVARWGDILTANTGTYQLDVDYEYLWQCECPDWCRENIEQLTRQWQRAEVVWNSTVRLAEWLEEDPPARFGELLDFIEGRMNEPQP